MDFRKLADGAETLFNRAKQFTEEKLGQTEKTEFDPNFQALLDGATKTKHWTEKLIKDIEAVLQPNQAARLEDFVTEKLQTNKAARTSEVETFAQTLNDAALDFGSTTPFGATLLKCSEAETKVAEAWKKFSEKVIEEVLLPFKIFIEKDFAAMTKERKVLETKRLDLDVAKGKYKKATAPGKEPDPNTLLKVEEDLKASQGDFDRQLEITQNLLEGLASFQDAHVKRMNDFHCAQAEYFQACCEATKNN